LPVAHDDDACRSLRAATGWFAGGLYIIATVLCGVALVIGVGAVLRELDLLVMLGVGLFALGGLLFALGRWLSALVAWLTRP